MSRISETKELTNTRLASGHGGWIYCDSCGENIGYLCYVTYDDFTLTYQCKCGACGSMHIAFEEPGEAADSESSLITIKNRLCCPEDNSPLFTILYNKLASYAYEVVCTACKHRHRHNG